MKTLLSEFLRQPLIERLGWTLLHFLWQGAAVAATFGVVLLVLRRRSANARYVAGCLALGLLVLLPVATAVVTRVAAVEPRGGVIQNTQSLSRLDDGINLAPLPTSHATGLHAEGYRSVLRTLAVHLQPLLPGLVALWFMGVVVLSARVAGGWVQVQRMKQHVTVLTDVVWNQRLTRLARSIGISRPVQLLESAWSEIPTVIGWLQPMILLPVSTLNGLSPQQLDAILAHELAHIRRHDYLVNLLQTVAETLLFYHPAVWWISRRIRQERENCCDDLAVAVCGDRVAYAQALTVLEELRVPAAPPLAMAAHGGSLLQRIARLVTKSESHYHRPASWFSLFIVNGLMIGFAATVILAADSAGTVQLGHGATASQKMPESKSTVDFLARGKAKQSGRDYAGAITEYTRAIESDSKCTEAYFQRGNARRSQGDEKGAIDDYHEAIKLDPNQGLTGAVYFYERGNAELGRRDYTGALKDYTQAIEFNPHYVEAYINRGDVRRGQGDENGAIADYSKAVELNPQLDSLLRQFPSATNTTAPQPPTVASMQALAERIANGDSAAFAELRDITQALYKDITDYNKQAQRVLDNYHLMHAAFDELGGQAARGNETAYLAIKACLGEKWLHSFAPDALGLAAAGGNTDALDILLNYKASNILWSDAVFALQAPAKANIEPAVNFLIGVIENPQAGPLWYGAAQGLDVAAKSNPLAKAAVEKYAATIHHDKL